MTSPGLDLIFIFFRHMPNRIINGLLKVFNKRRENAEVPNKWKAPVVVPILKPNKDNSKPESYRPIACFHALEK